MHFAYLTLEDGHAVLLPPNAHPGKSVFVTLQKQMCNTATSMYGAYFRELQNTSRNVEPHTYTPCSIFDLYAASFKHIEKRRANTYTP